ncbi:DUF1214 domain-containing protein [Streptomyces sp. MI02-7b]|uniref:DUF1214 domain-containing protein n=1 Tax=Streptomyces sp. MI02-7b TaxID=462941 RepID=UPI0039F556DD
MRRPTGAGRLARSTWPLPERGLRQPADGRYVLRFVGDDLPPAVAFWSLTIYDEDMNPILNPATRGSAGDRTAVWKEAPASSDQGSGGIADPPAVAPYRSGRSVSAGVKYSLTRCFAVHPDLAGAPVRRRPAGDGTPGR